MRRIVACLLLCLLPWMAASADIPEIGVCIYDTSDTFINSMRLHIESSAADRAKLTVYDSRNDQNLQIEQVQTLLEYGVDVLILNPVDRLAAGYLIELARQQNVPVVFINREPLQEDLLLYDKAYYVGADGAQSGRLSGEILADYFLKHPEADLNGDGVVQYVLIKGEPGHQDAELRTQYALMPLQNAGFQVEKLQEDTGMWQRRLAQDHMTSFLAAWGERIECVIANNDDMALGAIDALKAAGYFTGERYMPVVGVDAPPLHWRRFNRVLCWARCSTMVKTRPVPRWNWRCCWHPARSLPWTTTRIRCLTVAMYGSPISE